VPPQRRPGEDRARMVLPQLRLDDLLAELQTRLAAVLSTRDRVHALLEAVVSIESDLDLDTVLRRIVEAAMALVDARYGALGVLGDGDRLARFVTVGVTEEEIDRIGHWPTGQGLLGTLIKQQSAIRTSPRTRTRPGFRPVIRRCGASSASRCAYGTRCSATST
jgi:hypothetical protein